MIVIGFIVIALFFLFCYSVEYGICLTLALLGITEFVRSIINGVRCIKEKNLIIYTIITWILAVAMFIVGFSHPLVIFGKRFMPIFATLAYMGIPLIIYNAIASEGGLFTTFITFLIVAVISTGFCSIMLLKQKTKILNKMFDPHYKITDVRNEETSPKDTLKKALNEFYEAEKKEYPEKNEEELFKVFISDLEFEETFKNEVRKKYYYNFNLRSKESEDVWIVSFHDVYKGNTYGFRINLRNFDEIEEVELEDK